MSITVIKLCFETESTVHSAICYYAPNFEKVDGAYCFWSVRGCLPGSHFFVPTVTFKPFKPES